MARDKDVLSAVKDQFYNVHLVTFCENDKKLFSESS